MNFEDQLRGALRRERPPAGFAARVVASARPRAGWRVPAVLAMAAGLVAAVLVSSAVSEHRARERDRALEAKARLLEALGVTRAQFQQVKEEIQRSRGFRQ